MANRYAVANGNWSNTATWDGGTLPAQGDDVRANSYTVTIDQDITVNSIRNDAFSPAVLGGKFIINSTGLNVLCDIYAASSNCLEISGFSGETNVTGNVYATNNNGSAILLNGANITINLTGEAYSGFMNSGSGATSNSGLIVTAGNFNFIGNAYARGGGYACGIYSSAANSTNTFNGNAYNNSIILHANGAGLLVSGANQITVMDGIAESISNLQTQILASAVFVSNGFFSGNVIAIGSELGVGSGINCSALGSAIIKKSINRSGLGALSNIKYSQTEPSIDVLNENNNIITLTDPSQTNPPAESNVRLGTSYSGGAFTGTLIIPNPEDVRKGVAVDDTVGTGIITGTDFFNLIATSTDPVAERLRNVATVQTVGDQFNSF